MTITIKTRPGEDDDVDWCVDVQRATWIKKRGEVVDPHTREILAHAVLTVNDFTRRGVTIKMTKWLGQYATNQKIAAYILERITRMDAMVFSGDGSWVRLNRSK